MNKNTITERLMTKHNIKPHFGWWHDKGIIIQARTLQGTLNAFLPLDDEHDISFADWWAGQVRKANEL